MRFSYLLLTTLVLYIATVSSARLDNTKNSLDSIPIISSHDFRVEQAQVLKKRQYPGFAQTAQIQSPAQGTTQSYAVVSGSQGGVGNLPAEVANGVILLPGQAVANAGQVPTQLQGSVTQLLGSVKFGR